MASTPFLSVEGGEKGICCLCNENIKDNDIVSNLSDDGLKSLQELADRWVKINKCLCSQPPYTEFLLAAPRLSKAHNDINIHENCRITFRNRLSRKEAQSSKLISAHSVSTHESSEAVAAAYRTRRGLLPKKQMCFVCNEETKYDNKPYNNGGLGRCSEQNAVSKIKCSMDLKMKDEKSKYHAAAKRLEVILSGSSYDIFALDLYYHKTCYVNFTYAYDKKQPIADKVEKDKLGSEVMDRFFHLFHRKVIKDQNAYLLTELIEDIKEMSEDNDLDDPPITKTFTLKTRLIAEFGDSIDYHIFGNRLVVHSSAVNPISYSAATIQGNGLRETDLTKAFSRLIRRKLSKRNAIKWPLEADELFNLFDSHKPLHCIYNAICWSINPRRSTSEFGYATVASRAEAEKISAISQSWEKMDKAERSPLGTALSLTIHRITGSKEATTLLNRCGVGIPYTDVRDLNNKWAKSITMEHKKLLPPCFIQGRSVHITFDNSDGKQQTLTGSQTTHHTTGTIFQAVHEDDPTAVTASKQEQSNIIDQQEADYGSFKIPKKRAPPPSFPDYTDDYRDTLKRNIAWVLVGTVGDDCLEEYFPDVVKDELGPVGSWTSFMKTVTNSITTKCKLEYLPVVPLPPGDNVIKWYMDMMMEIAHDLELDYIFAHADEAINSKMLILSWLNQDEYDKIIPLMGGFHTILVILKILFKMYGCLGFKDWWVDAGAIADGSAAQAFEGRHYARSVRLHKQSFEALVKNRMREENIVIKLDQDMRNMIAKLRSNPCSENLESLIGLPGFKDLCSSLMKSEGTQAKMMVDYLNDVSAMLCFIAAVREKNIEAHLAAERVLLPKCFAFGHVNYARYLTFQYVNF